MGFFSDILNRRPDTAKESSSSVGTERESDENLEPTPEGFSTVEQEFLGEGENEAFIKLEAYWDSLADDKKELSLDGVDDQTKVLFAQRKLEIIRNGLGSGLVEGTDTAREQIAILEQSWDQYGREAADRLWSELGEPGEEVPAVSEIPTLPGEQKIPGEKPLDLVAMLQEYLDLDLATRQANDALAATGYDKNSSEHATWLQKSDEQRALWNKFPKERRDVMLNNGIHLKAGGNALRRKRGLEMAA
jgi:hypothetical protein